MVTLLRPPQRFALGLFLVLLGLMHAVFGTAVVQDVSRSIVAGPLPPITSTLLATILFMVAIAGFVAAGIGVWGTPALRTVWSPLTNSAVLASTLLIVLEASPPTPLVTVCGLALNTLALAVSGAPFARVRSVVVGA